MFRKVASQLTNLLKYDLMEWRGKKRERHTNHIRYEE